MSSDRGYNGMPASELDVEWVKSERSNPNGECVEIGLLRGGQVAVRNSRFPDGPALVFPREDVAALIRAAREGELDALARR